MANNPNGATGGQVSRYDATKITRHDFPDGFLFGAATSAYQVEGAYAEDRKGLNNWDVWSLQRPGKITDGNNGCVAIDHYNQFKEDVRLMKKLGIDVYRLSISWARILPGGRLSGGINREGVRFYNKLIDLLLAEDITPFVTIFHFDVPQVLQTEYGGFLSRKIIPDFAEYAEVCFFEFGDRVRFWITQNEPWTFTHHGYVNGLFPPGHGSDASATGENRRLRPRCPKVADTTCSGGDPGTEPYIVAHNVILAHATAVDVYRRKYQAVQGGKIGVTNMTTWYEPYTNSQEDIDAAKRAVDFMWGWFVAPIVTGDYPPVMRERVGSRLPTFTAAEKTLITGSYDFLGMNYYTTYLASNNPPPAGAPPTYDNDEAIEAHYAYPDGTPIGQQAGSDWLYIVPWGIKRLVEYNAQTYGNPIVYITENGVSELYDPTVPVGKAIQDDFRISYHQEHLAYLKEAMDDGANVKGYILWSLVDNFEWAAGFSQRFGLFYVDFVNHLIRYPKSSAIWYMNFLNKNKLQLPSTKRQVVEEVEVDHAASKRKRNR